MTIDITLVQGPCTSHAPPLTKLKLLLRQSLISSKLFRASLRLILKRRGPWSGIIIYVSKLGIICKLMQAQMPHHSVLHEIVHSVIIPNFILVKRGVQSKVSLNRISLLLVSRLRKQNHSSVPNSGTHKGEIKNNRGEATCSRR